MRTLPPEIKQILDWIVSHPKYAETFVGYNEEQTLHAIMTSIMSRGCLVVNNKTGGIDGVLLSKIDFSLKLIHIIAVITNHKRSFKTMVEFWKAYYPMYDVSGRRDGKLKRFYLKNFKTLGKLGRLTHE